VASEHQTQLRRAVIASTIGIAIEWYDFFLYSTVTGLVGFVARPVGAAIFGPLRRPHRPQVDADRDAAAHGPRHYAFLVRRSQF
jgi:hypothetical protein